jgi:glycosyl hydrolase family 106( putative alpha-L-rhamnosidase)
MRFAFFVCLMWSASAATVADLRLAFEHPPDDARIMVRWWWFGPSQTKAEIEREMRQMKAAGIGGFEVQPVYPLSLENNYRYLSPEFLDALRFAAATARELGLRMDVTLGSGWPFGGPQVPITQAAGRLRIDRLSPPPEDGDTPIANLNGLFFTSSRTRQMVKRAASGAEGFVLDHYDRSAVDAYLNAVGEPLLKALADNPPHAIFSDSLEVYGSDWTPKFLDEFRRRRGYDLTPYLASIVGNDEKSAAARHDWGQTLTELVNDNYLTPVREWAARHHTRFRSQTYGTPPVNLSSNALVDLAEGEGWQWRQFSNTRWASSANHLYKRAITSSETWTWLHSPVFRATPLDLKAEADLHFLEGVNQIVGHGWPYSPLEVGEPGWHFYAAAALNPHNPWWIVMPDVAAYLQRVSFLLRQGEPVNDVAIYLPTDDAYAHFTPGHASVSQLMNELIGPNLISQILDAGYNFDFIDDAAIAHGGIPYRILILPGVERIPLSTLRTVEKYTSTGGMAIATRRAPSLAPGLMDQDTPQIRELSQKLFATTYDEASLVTDLHHLLPADLAADPAIGFVHRKTPDADIYFVVNTSNLPVHSQALFRIAGLNAAWWDPFTGKSSSARGTDLDLAPYESRVLVFSKERAKPMGLAHTDQVIDLSSDWKITIAGVTETMPMLHSWTDDPRWAAFSGQAIYQKTFRVRPSARPRFLTFGEGTPIAIGSERRAGSGMRAWLENPVREAAVVYVNGKRAGSVWRPPYEIDVTGLLAPGNNTIRIVVANLAINAMAGHPEDNASLIVHYGERFQPQDMDRIQPEPSGLLGPIHLVTR